MPKRDARHCTPLSQTCRVGPSIDPKCRVNGIQHSGVAERLVQKFHGSLLECLRPDAIVFLTGDEDYGNLSPTTFQFLLQVKSVHSRHSDVEHQTPGGFHIIRREKVWRRRKSFSVKAELPQQVG